MIWVSEEKWGVSVKAVAAICAGGKRARHHWRALPRQCFRDNALRETTR